MDAFGPEEADPGKPGTPPSPGCRAFTLEAAGGRPSCTRPCPARSGPSQGIPARPAQTPETLCNTGSNSSHPQNENYFQDPKWLPMSSSNSPSLPFPSPDKVKPVSWLTLLVLREPGHPATSHFGRVTRSQLPPKAEGSAWNHPSGPTQTHHQWPGHPVQLHVQLKQVEHEEGDCHQPEEDSDEHHPAVGRVQVVRGVGNQGPHQQPQRLQGRDGPESAGGPSTRAAGWMEQGPPGPCPRAPSHFRSVEKYHSAPPAQHRAPSPWQLPFWVSAETWCVPGPPGSSDLDSRTLPSACEAPPAPTPWTGILFLSPDWELPQGRTASLMAASRHPVQDLGAAKGFLKAAERMMTSPAHLRDRRTPRGRKANNLCVSSG